METVPGGLLWGAGEPWAGEGPGASQGSKEGQAPGAAGPATSLMGREGRGLPGLTQGLFLLSGPHRKGRRDMVSCCWRDVHPQVVHTAPLTWAAAGCRARSADLTHSPCSQPRGPPADPPGPRPVLMYSRATPDSVLVSALLRVLDGSPRLCIHLWSTYCIPNPILW